MITPTVQDAQRMLEDVQLLSRRVVTRDRLINLGAPSKPLILAARGISSVLTEIGAAAERLQEIEQLESIWQDDEFGTHRWILTDSAGDWWCDTCEYPHRKHA